jgi:conjugal transfer ATP-binding protein TraC
LIDFPNSNFILQIDNLERFKSVKEIDSAVNNLKASTINKNLKSSVSIDVEQQIESFEDLLEDVISGQELVKNITINITLYAKTKQELNDQRTKFTKNITSLGFQIDQNLFYQYQAFKSCLPLAKSKNQINNQIIPCRTLAAGITCSYQKIIDGGGFYFGKINKSQGYLVFDLFKQNNQRTNSNMFIIGTSGSGKSFTTKKIINQLAKKQTKIICLDPEREYQKLAENYQGN